MAPEPHFENVIKITFSHTDILLHDMLAQIQCDRAFMALVHSDFRAWH